MYHHHYDNKNKQSTKQETLPARTANDYDDSGATEGILDTVVVSFDVVEEELSPTMSPTPTAAFKDLLINCGHDDEFMDHCPLRAE
jgi:hypothetical protein